MLKIIIVKTNQNISKLHDELLKVIKHRPNIIPILDDANHPDRYFSAISQIDFIYQDISQRNQAEIFIANIRKYLKKKKDAIIMVKARSIDVSLKPKQAFYHVCSILEEEGIKVTQKIELSPYEKDHAAILISI